MRRKVNLLIILFAMVLCLSLVFVACGKVDLSAAPNTIGGEDEGKDISEKAGSTDENLMLRFVFTEYMSSVFTKVPLEVLTAEGFDIGSIIKYQVCYVSTGLSIDNKLYPLTLETVHEEDRPLLKLPGKHYIHCSLPVSGRKATVDGSFTLNVAEAESDLEFIKLRFKLNGATGYFGKVDPDQQGYQVIEVQKGSVCDTWIEFERTFLALKSGCVLSGLYSGNVKVYDPDSTEAIVFNADATYEFIWSDAVVNVDFVLNAPNEDYKPTYGNSPLTRREQVEAQLSTQTPAMEVDTVRKPNADIINAFYGYNFAGWYTEEGERWLFTQTVGRKDFTLYARWTPVEYSLTVFTMGGTFKDNLQDTITAEQIAAGGYAFVNSDVQFDLATGDANKITFSGFTYHVGYDKYVTNIQTKKNSQDTITIKLVDLLSVLEKAGGNFDPNGIYRDEIHTDRINKTAAVQKDETAYVDWILNAEVKADEARLVNVLSDYYNNYAFKDGITLKADGTLRLDKLVDASMNEFILPAELYYGEGNNRKLHPVTEIGNRALVDSKSLVTVDLSRASNLTTIGTRGFGSCLNLKTVILPTDNHITEVGEDAFAKTYWQEHYNFGAGNTKGIIKIGTALYKYTGEGVDGVTSINMSDLGYYTGGDTNVYNISAGCFTDATALESITIADNIDYIHNNAFNGLANLTTVTAGAKLAYIEENAFSNEFLAQTTGPNVSNGAIVVGNILFRVLDPQNVTSYEVKDDIIYIAPGAFKDCSHLATVTFEDESKIKAIGKDAFISTAWIKDRDFTVVNGILAAVYSQDYNNKNVVISNDVKIISEYAFNTYARFFETIEFRAGEELGVPYGVEKIDDYAFAGASNIKSFIFTDAKVVAGELVGIPEISNYSFANSKGELLSGVKIYVNQDVYDFLGTNECKTNNPVWYKLFSLNGDAFRVETIQDAYLNPSIKKDRILDGVITAFGNETNGIIVESNSGVKKYFDLNTVTHKVKYYVLRVDSNGDPVLDANGNRQYDKANAVTEGVYYIQFEFEGVEYSHFDDEHAFVINVHNAIRGLPAIGSTLVADGYTSLNDYWITGFEGDITSAAVPTFYTSKTTAPSVTFHYRDYLGNLRDIDASQVTGYNPSASKESHAVFTIDFYGIGNYYVSMTHKGVVSLYEEIIQKDAISIPLNASGATYLRNSHLYLKGQDGKEVSRPITLTSLTFKILEVDGVATETLVTNRLGLHTARIAYSGNDATDTLEKEIVYAVVLEADNTAFTMEVKETSGTAKIVACSTKTADTLVLPDKYTVGGKTYTVTEIGEGVFKNFVSLKTVYMPATIEVVGKSAFEGCTLLEEIFTATQTSYAAQEISSVNFDDTSTEITYYGTVEVNDLIYTIFPSAITIPTSFTWTEIDGTTTSKYIATPVFTNKLFDRFRGTIWLYDNEYNREYASAHLSGKTYKFYTEADERVPAAQSRFQLNKTKFVASEEFIVKEARLKSLTNIAMNEDGNIVIMPSFTKPDVIEKDENDNVILVIHETDYITSTTATLMVPAGFVKNDGSYGAVYLPDKIYNFLTILDRGSNPLADALTIYKSGSTTLVNTIERVPDSLEYIDTSAFRGCLSLTTLDIGEDTKLEDIATMAFANSGLEVLDLSHTSIQEVSNSTFENCSNLVEIVLPNTVTDIGRNAFLNCVKLTSFTVPENVVSILDEAFLGCYRLVEIHNLSGMNIERDPDAPEANGWIAAYALGVYTDGDSKLLTTPNGYVLYKDGPNVILVDYIGVAISLVIPDEVTRINAYALIGHGEITAITIPVGVVMIGKGALLACFELKTITYKGTSADWSVLVQDFEDDWDGGLDYEMKYLG